MASAIVGWVKGCPFLGLRRRLLGLRGGPNGLRQINDNREEMVKELFLIKEKPAKERKYKHNKLRKLYRVYRHPSTNKLRMLIKDGGI